MTSKAFLALAASAAAIVGASAAGAQQSARALSQSEVAQAAQQHPQIVQEFGGEEGGARGAYVRQVGQRITAHAGIAGGGGAFNVTTLNSPVMNAFAVPGGYLYITRQLLGLMNSEAELASVLGHEAAHVAARHSRGRQRTGILSQLGAILVGVATGSGQLAQIASQVGQGLFLQYSRSQEFEADDLGIRYMAAAGYDPMESPRLLASLGAWSDMEPRFAGREADRRATPSWARTHPLSADRVNRATRQAQATGRANQGMVNREQHLNALNGMIFDDDPAQGVIEGRDFLHPDLRLAFTAPQGFGMQNGTRAVTLVGQSGQAQFTMLPYQGNLDAYVGQAFQSVLGGQAQVAYSQPQRTTINGIPAAASVARVQTQQGVLDVGVVAYEFARDRAYHFVTVSPAGRGFGQFGQMIQSVRRLTPQQAAAIRPRVIQIVTAGPNDTVQSLAARMAYPSFQLERFRILNGLAANQPVRAGQRVKLVVYRS
jgi:predicted Zn-dependent protease